MSTNILLVDDEQGVREGLKRLLSLRGYRSFEADSIARAREILHRQEIQLVLLDLRLGNEDGIDLLREIRYEPPSPSVIVITGFGDVRSAVECMQLGAVNYITKPIDHDLLLSILKREEEAFASARDNAAFRETLASASKQAVIVGTHPEMKRILSIIDKVRDSEATVLILGETGTGKEVMAKRIHYTGQCRDRPFVGINCAALNDGLLESELFGHERGAFTGAVARKIGKFELAGSGTLFLDEVGDMSLAMQSKLLRVLQEKTFDRVGGTRTLTARCRVIASTNRDLEQMMRRGTFRDDLYYRLTLITIKLPPLRDRAEDIPALVEIFVEEANRRFGRRITRISESLIGRLTSYSWPGNIRQLKNVIANAVILSEGPELQDLDLPQSSGQPSVEPPIRLEGDLKSTIASHASRLEEKLIRGALERSDSNITRAAAELGITRKTLYAKMRAYGL